jgi:plasmid stability protein
MATLTIKNIPDEVYAALTAVAKKHRRSLNSEAIVRLERSLKMPDQSREEQLEQIRKFRDSVKGVYLTDEILDLAKNEGRP